MHGIGESIAIMFPGRDDEAFGRVRHRAGRSGWWRRMRACSPRRSRRSGRQPGVQFGRRPRCGVGENIINTLGRRGSIPIYGEMRNIIPGPGRAVHRTTPTCASAPGGGARRRGRSELLFGEGEAIGKVVMIGEVPFTVVGVMQKKTQNSSYNRRDKDRVFIPRRPRSPPYSASTTSTTSSTSPQDPTRSEEVTSRCGRCWRSDTRFDPADKDAVWIWDTAEMDKFIFYFFLAFNIFMGLIGSFTLAVAASAWRTSCTSSSRSGSGRSASGARSGATRARTSSSSSSSRRSSSSGSGRPSGSCSPSVITEALQYIPIKEFVGTPEISSRWRSATLVVLSAIGLAAGSSRRAAPRTWTSSSV